MLDHLKAKVLAIVKNADSFQCRLEVTRNPLKYFLPGVLVWERDGGGEFLRAAFLDFKFDEEGKMTSICACVAFPSPLSVMSTGFFPTS